MVSKLVCRRYNNNDTHIEPNRREKKDTMPLLRLRSIVREYDVRFLFHLEANNKK